MYTLISDMILSLSYMSRFSDWGHVPTQGFWCQFHGFLLVVGAHSVNLWVFATATWLLVLFLREKPSIKLELFFLSLWPISILLACIPYMLNYIYTPTSTGQCYLLDPNLTIYLVIIWLALVLLYVLLSYLFLAIYIYVNSIKDKTRRKQVITLAMSPVIYVVSFLWVIVARLSLLSRGSIDINLLRASITISITVGFLSSIWFGFSRKIYKHTYEKLVLNKNISDTDEKSVKGSKNTGQMVTGEDNAGVKNSIQ